MIGLDGKVVNETAEKPDIAGVLATIEYIVGVPDITEYGISKLVAVFSTCAMVPIDTEEATNGVAVALATPLVQEPTV